MLVAKLPLPDECIDLVIAYLPEERQALHGLVLACRKLFQRAVPVLYKSPFTLIDAHGVWNEHEKEKRYLILLALLLNSRIGRISGDCHCDSSLLDTKSRSTNSTTSTSTYSPHQHMPYTVDYLRFYTHQFPVNLWRPLTNLRSVPLTPLVVREITGKTVSELQTEIAHSLIEYHPRDIRVLGQPIARTSILLQSIKHLHNLVRLELSEIVFGCKVEPILEFIRVHDAMHNTLREIKIKSPEEGTHHYEPSHTHLVRIVQAMRNPQVVDARHWREAITVLDQIPADCLKTLLLGLAEMPPSKATSEFLAQCVFLENVRMPVRDSQLFRWAVAARRRTTGPAGEGGGGGGGFGPRHVPYYAAPFVGAPSMAYLGPLSPWGPYTDWLTGEEHFGPARLKSVELCGEDFALIPALKDAADAFRDSLEQIKGISLTMSLSRVTVNIMNTLSWSWPMEQLSVIDLEGEVALAFDLAVLQFCPRLTTLRLSLPPYLFSTSEDDRVLQELKARLPQILLARHLLDLELHGKWPLSDALLVEIGGTMARLRRLYIGYCLGYSREGVQMLLDGIDENEVGQGHGSSRLEWVAISRWMFSRHTSNDSRIRYEG
ncbi:hypothetical protein BGZ74_007190 [Mortierella antarctica]|nr:hypothetical protein BGZ74_007190 [Mortierella antarctica]